MTIQSIIEKVRFSLADTNKDRWSDNRLINLLNDSLADLAITTSVFNHSVSVQLVKDLAYYDLSNDFISISSVQYKDKELMVKSHTEMSDLKGKEWREVSGTPEFIVHDLYTPGKFILYPRPIEGVNITVDYNSLFGLVTSIKIPLFSPVYDINFNSNLGLSFINANSNELIVFGLLKPKKIVSISDVWAPLDNNVQLINAIAHYITGNALLDNFDSRNEQLGIAEIQMYEKFKNDIQARDSLDNFVANDKTRYFSGFE